MLEANALVQLAAALQWLEDFPAALQRAQEAIEIAEAHGAPGPLGGALYVRSYVFSVTGKLEESEAGYTRAIEIVRAQGDRSAEALALHMVATQRSWQGRYSESLELSREGTRLGREGRLVVGLLRNLWTQGLALTDTGSYDAALAAFSEGQALAEKIGDDAYLTRFLNTVGWLRIECADLTRGIDLSELSYEVTGRSSRAGHGTGAERRAFIRNNEGEALMVRGELGAAAEALAESHHIVQHPPPSRWMTWRYTTQCYAGLAQLALLQGDPGRAQRLADQSLEVAVPTRSRKFESWAWRMKGEGATLRGAWGEAEDALRRALSLAEAIGQPRQTWLSHVALGRLDAANGRRDSALGRYRSAWAIITGLRARTTEPTLRAGLESSPLAREVEHLARPE